MTKKILSIATAVILAFASFSLSAQDRLFGELSNLKGVTSVYVGKSMLQLAGSSINMADGINTSRLLSKMTGVEVVTCENKKSAKEMNKKIDAIIRTMPDLEVLTEVNDNDSKDASHVVIYSKSNPDTGVISTLLITAISPDDPTVVAIHGNFTPDDIAAALSSVSGNADANASDSPDDSTEND